MYLTWWEAERSLVPVQCCRLYEMKWLQHKLWFSQVGVLEWNSIHLCNPDITTLPLTLLGCGANDNLSFLLILCHLLLLRDAAPNPDKIWESLFKLLSLLFVTRRKLLQLFNLSSSVQFSQVLTSSDSSAWLLKFWNEGQQTPVQRDRYIHWAKKPEVCR